MKNWWNAFAGAVLFLPSITLAGKILILHPVYAGSHILTVRTIAEELASRGHKVRVVRWLEANEIPQLNSDSVSETVLSVNNSDGSVPYMTKEERAKFQFPVDLLWRKGINPLSAVFDGGFISVAAACKTLFENRILLNELKKEKFDVAIVDLIYNECELALAAHYLGLNVVAFWGLSLMSGESQYTTAFNPPSLIPHCYFPYTDKMSFLKRVLNTLYGLGSHIIMQIQFSYTNYYIQKYLKDCPHPSELLMNVSGILINSNMALDYPRQLPPSFFHIGGLHIKNPRPLPQEIAEFMDGADHGIILFSLGLNFDSEAMPQYIYEAYFRVFGRLKQRVIVKSRKPPAFIPSNIKVLPYVPQTDILAHPKTVLFMTHCGIHGAMEGIHHGIKMIGIPLFFDQKNIAIRLEDLGIGIALDKRSTETEIFDAVTKILSDPLYDDNMRNINTIYRSSFEKPMDRAVWLIEHVMTSNGATYLKMQSRNLNFAQYFLLDVALVLLVSIFACICICCKIFQRIFQVVKIVIESRKEKVE